MNCNLQVLDDFVKLVLDIQTFGYSIERILVDNLALLLQRTFCSKSGFFLSLPLCEGKLVISSEPQYGNNYNYSDKITSWSS